MNVAQFLAKLEEQCSNFHLWCTYNEDKDQNVLSEYHWKARSGINQWEHSDEPFDTAEEALLDFLSQVTRFTLEKNG